MIPFIEFVMKIKKKQNCHVINWLSSQTLCISCCKKDKTTEKITKPVKITTFNFTHNHVLNKQMLTKAKRATHQYIIPPEACQKMLSLIEDRPIYPLHLQNFLKQFYPKFQAVTHQMMFNYSLKCKDLEMKFGYLGNVPTDHANAIF